jgi:peroxiredoxin
MKLLLLVPSALAVCSAAGLLLIHPAAPRQPDFGIDFGNVRHYVTKEMEIETAAAKNRRLPELPGTTELGKTVDLAPPNGKLPQFVLFIKSACPCNIDAQPLFNRLARKYEGKVEFLGVIDGNRDEARDYAERYTVSFPVVADKEEHIIKGFQAKGGLYSVLVARNGHIVKMWPGYSVDILAEMNRLLSEEVGVQVTPFDPQYAPKVKAAGCAFYW